MARPKKNETLTTISVRLTPRLVEEVDGCAEVLQKEAPLLQVTRTDAIRYLIQTGLEGFHAERKKRRKPARR